MRWASQGTVAGMLVMLLLLVLVNLHLANRVNDLTAAIEEAGWVQEGLDPSGTRAGRTGISESSRVPPQVLPPPMLDVTPVPEPPGEKGGVGDLIMVGREGVEQVAATEEASGGMLIRIRYQNRGTVPLRPDVEVALKNDRGEWVAGLRVSWWHSVLEPGRSMETSHVLEKTSAVARVEVIKPGTSEEEIPETETPLLPAQTWVYRGKAIAVVLPENTPVEVLEELSTWRTDARTLVPFEELVAEFHKTSLDWEFFERGDLNNLDGWAPATGVSVEGSRGLGWAWVRWGNTPEQSGWVKSESMVWPVQSEPTPLSP